MIKKLSAFLLVLVLALVTAAGASAAPGKPEPGTQTGTPTPAPARVEMRFERFSSDQGLSMSVVNAIAQDQQGFLWLATQDGLNRFDGSRFVIYKHDVDDPYSLSHNWVETVYVDSGGYLWVGTYAGLDRYDPQTGQFSHYPHDPANPDSLSHDTVHAIYEDKDSRLWVGTEAGLDILDRQTGRFTHLRDDPAAPEVLGSSHIRHVTQDSAGRLWFSISKGGLVGFDPATGKYSHYTNDINNPTSLSYDTVIQVLEDHAGRLWVATYNGLNRLDPLTGAFERFKNDPTTLNSLSGNYVLTLYEDHKGLLWIGTWGEGLNLFDPQTGRFTRLRNEVDNPNSLSENYIKAIFEDASGVIWLGSWGGGLNRYDPRTAQFAHYRFHPDDPNSLSSPSVWPVAADGDVVWIGTLLGLDRLDRRSGQFAHYKYDPNNPGSLAGNFVEALLIDHQGVLWAGVERGGLNRYNPAIDQFTRYLSEKDNPNSLSGETVKVLAEDANGNIWVGTNNGLDRLDPATGHFTHYLSDPEDEKTLSSNYILALHFDHSGVLWVGTPEGVNRYDPRTGQFTRLQHDPQNPNSLNENQVMSILEDHNGILWFGTLGGGLNRYDPADGSFKAYYEKNGLPNETIYGVLEDDDGFLWISTNKGLSRFDPQRETFDNYDVRDGLQNNEFNGNSYGKNKATGELLFGGINGLTIFSPKDIRHSAYLPPVRLVSFTQGEKPVQGERTPYSLEEVTLRWPDNYFEFEMAALSYAQSDRNQFAYMLEGLDKDWIYAGTNRIGRYTNLPGGKYTLRIKAANHDGTWNEQGTALRIAVVPPFWQTFWFRLSMLALLAGLVAAGIRARVRSVEAHSRELEAQVVERTQEIERRRQELEALYQADEDLYRTLHLDQVLQSLVDSAIELLDADKGSLLVWDEAHQRLNARVTRGFDDATIPRLSFAPGEGVAGLVAQTGEPVIINNTQYEPRVTHSVIDVEGIRCFLQVPIKVGGEVFGVFSADYTTLRPIGESELHLLTSLAQRAAIAIQNAQMYEQTQEQAVAEERSRLARELHDAVTQTLFSASLLAEALPAAWESDPAEGRQLLGELRQLSRGALAEMRTLLMELRPSVLMEANLQDLIRQLGEAASGREGIPVNVMVDGRVDLPPDVHIALYRIAQEALNNALKHARASHVTVHLRKLAPLGTPTNGNTEGVVLTVRDDGRGFDPERTPSDHLGLGIMRERAQAVGATLTVESQPGHGTQVTVLWEK